MLRTRTPFLVLLSILAMLVVPAGANAAILIGMESNRELVNTTQTPELQGEALQKMKDQGVQVVRANFRWYDVAEGCAGQTATQLENHLNSCYSWGRLDSLVQQANDRQMQVLLSLTQNPSWLHPNAPANVDGLTYYFMGTTPAQFARTVEHYVAFHKAAGTRYRQGSGFGFVKFWTIHNEPNSKYYWGPTPNPARYAQLYGKTAVALRAANPGARIAPGPTGPTGGTGGVKPLDFLVAFQRSVPAYLPGSMANKRKYINAWAHNPYPGSTTPPSVFQRTLHPRNVTMGSIDRIFKQLDASPITRGTKVWATEFGWETNGPGKVSEINQARFIAEAFDWLDSKRRVELGISYGLTDPPAIPTFDWTSGTFTNAGVKKRSYAMFQRMVSVPQAAMNNTVRAGTRLRVWGRANVNPARTQLAYRIIGRKCDARAAVSGFCMMKGQAPASGVAPRVAFLTAVRGQTLDFAVYDPIAETYGPTRRVIVR
jgi:hypothetical protein